ncbi:MAG: heavy-metal-associated domain-containing protein [Ignavibacteria bacterium]|jgi:copper chaperone CopZ|nr:heavy-metal-associated domain-containing protein [Ignavibacteria bacterium]
MKKIAIFILFLLAPLSLVHSQVIQATVGVDGFTCSLCAKGVEEEFMAMDFVKSVKADLKKATFTIVFKKDARIDINMLKDGVTDGGFSVRDILIKAEGTYENNHLITGNTPDLILKNLSSEYNNGDKIAISGIVSLSDNIIKVKQAKKI